MGVREYAISFLPAKPALDPALAVDKFIALHFDFLYKIRNENSRLESDKKMCMIGHAMDGKHFGFSILHKTSHIFLQFFFVVFWHKALPAFHSKNKLQINLGKRI